MPQCHILQGWNDRRADETRKPGEILGKHWIALVGHRGGAFLAFREELLRFQNFGPLKVPDFGRKPLDRARNHREDREIEGMPVARNDLG